MSYTKQEIKEWEEFEQACISSGITKRSFFGMEDVFDEFEKYKEWRTRQPAKKEA